MISSAKIAMCLLVPNMLNPNNLKDMEYFILEEYGNALSPTYKEIVLDLENQKDNTWMENMSSSRQKMFTQGGKWHKAIDMVILK